MIRAASILARGRARALLSPLPRAFSSAGPSTDAPPPPPPARPSLWARLVDDARDVLAVTFGVERARDVEAEYDAGLREYPWVTYEDAAGARVYRNRETGGVQSAPPPDWDRRAQKSAWLESERVASAVATVKQAESAWERTLRALGETPLIAGLISAGRAVAAGPVGAAVKSAGERASAVREDLQEKWETSQHPVIVNAA